MIQMKVLQYTFFYKFIEIVRILAVDSSSEIIHIEGLGEMSNVQVLDFSDPDLLLCVFADY